MISSCSTATLSEILALNQELNHSLAHLPVMAGETAFKTLSNVPTDSISGDFSVIINLLVGMMMT